MPAVRAAFAAVVLLTACSASHSASNAASDTPGVHAPRPLAPPSLSFSTSRLPLFRWALAPGSDGARVEICRDRSCQQLLASFDAVGESAAPTTELPSGLVFWRLRGLSGRTAGEETSAPWELVLPSQSAPVATTWGAMLDANGDGFGDVVVGDTNGFQPSQHVYVYLGGPHGPPATPTSILSDQAAKVHYAESIASLGDVDGDGYGDFAVGSPSEDTVYVYRGGPTGFADPPSLVLTGPAESRFGDALSGAGDVNADGYADLLVGLPIQEASGGSSVVGGARVYFGSASGLSSSAFVELEPPASSDEQGFGQFVSSAGDIDGDGKGDVAVYGGVGSFDPQRIYVYLGGSSLGAAPDATLEYDGTDYSWLDAANVLACAGDVDGDGYPDLAIGTPPLGASYSVDHVSIFHGGPSMSPDPWRRIDSPLSTSDHFGLSLAASDFDGDGVDDLAVGVLCFDPYPPSALVYAGSAVLPPLQTTITTRDRAWQAVRELGAADVDGDGFPDLVIGYPGRVTSLPGEAEDGGALALHGAVEIHRGGPSGVAAATSWTLLPPDDTAVAFGATLARP
jgi:hypothetical protein